MSVLGQEIIPKLDSASDALAQLKKLVEDNKLLLFIKGTADFPQCGFSARVIQIMDLLGVEFKTVDVLKNDIIREQIKVFSDWPTIPQVYFDGEFLGGCDIITEMYQRNELQEKLKTVNAKG